MESEMIHEIINEGFKCLGDRSPMLGAKIIYSSRLSAGEDNIVWRLYRLEDNEDWIKQIEPGSEMYSIDSVHAKEFVSLTNDDDHIQIDPGIKAFNHLHAIRKYMEMTGEI